MIRSAINMAKHIVTGFIFTLLLLAVSACQSDSQPAPLAAQQVAVTATTAPPTVTPTGTAAAQENRQDAVVTATAPRPLTPTAVPTSTATPPPSPTPLPEPSPTAAATAAPTESPTPLPTETAVPIPAPEWLSYLNRFRAMANLPLLSDQEVYTLGSRLHSRYMVANNEPIAHSEEKDKLFYDPAGDQAARNGNLFATSQMEANYLWSVNFWISAPFHLISILDPNLEVVGYGDYVEATGATQMASVLDISSHPAGTSSGISYPIMFPGNGSSTWVVRHSLFEWPYPFDGCPGFSPPTGPPIVLLLGDGSGTPNIINHRLAMGDQPLESCLFDETSYRNNDSYAQQVGREILDQSDAVVIMPRNPLPINETYDVQITTSDQTFTWRFSTQKGPD